MSRKLSRDRGELHCAGLGFSAEYIRDAAVVSATVIASLPAEDHFGKKLRTAR
jgi:hypothetical protein